MYSNMFENMQLVYSKLMDEESRDIFCNRVLFSMTRDWKYIRNIVGKYLRGYSSDKIFTGIEKNIEELALDCKKSYIIYGAGMYGQKAIDTLRKAGIEVIAFCDADKNKQGREYCGVNVISPQQLLEYGDSPILLAVWNQSQNIYRSLIQIGVKSDRIIDCFIIENYVDKDQYFDNDIIKFGKDEIFLDCGCFDFETSEIFASKCSKYKKIICFEPELKNRKVIEEKVACLGLSNVQIYPYGVWDKADTLCFGGSGSSARVSDDGDEKITVVAIDDVIDEKVSFIKMDIEGAELKALQGAKNTIIKDKPRLAISVYHKYEDIVEIAAYILSLEPNYQLYLRHYSNYHATETVLYAIYLK